MHRFDELDMKLLYELTKDGSISVPILSKNLGSMLLCFIVESRDY